MQEQFLKGAEEENTVIFSIMFKQLFQVTYFHTYNWLDQ